MLYDPYHDPSGHTQFIKQLWKRTNERNAAHEKAMRRSWQEKQRHRAGASPSGSNRSGGGSFYWLAALAFIGAMLLRLF